MPDDRAEHYLERALELRAMARSVKDKSARAMLLQTAREYIVLARAVRPRGEDTPEPDSN